MNNQTDQVSALKEAMLRRARRLADEHIAQGNMSRQKIMQDAREKIQLMEQKELLLAKAQSEREYLRKIQASEIQLQAELDRNRWGMVQVIVDKVRQQLQAQQKDSENYRSLFLTLLGNAAALIEDEQLIAHINAEDRERFIDDWPALTAKASDKNITLAPAPLQCSGGVKLVSTDGNVRVDNTFEGLMLRKQSELEQEIFERLFATVSGAGGLTHG